MKINDVGSSMGKNMRARFGRPLDFVLLASFCLYDSLLFRVIYILATYVPRLVKAVKRNIFRQKCQKQSKK